MIDASKAAEAALDAAERALEVVTRAEAVARADATTPESDITAWRFVRVVGFCLVSLIAAIWTALYVPAAFTDPAASITRYGAVQVAVATTSAEPDDNDPFGQYVASYHITGSYSQIDDTDFYTVWFRTSLQGRKFVLLLLGSAVLTDVGSPDTRVTVEHATCRHTSADGDTTPGKTEPCELVRGTVPTKPSGGDKSDCSFLGAADEGLYLSVFIHGTASVNHSVDWAHHTTQLPDFGNNIGGLAITELYGVKLGGRYGTASQFGCKDLRLNQNWVQGDADTTPTSLSPFVLRWPFPDGTDPIALVSSNRGIEGRGNLLLAIAGATAALSIGFMPVAYEARRAWWEHRRKVRSAG